MKFTISDVSLDDMTRILALFAGNSQPVQFSGNTIQNVAASPVTAAPTGDEDGPADSNAPAADSAGYPWDGRIHASSKAVNADGTWRRRRNIHEDVIKSVEAELQARQAQAPAAPVQPQQPAMPVPPQMPPVPMPPQVIPPTPAQPLQAPQQPAMPVPPQMPAAPVQPQQPVAPSGMDFTTFMQGIAPLMQQIDPSTGRNKIDLEYLNGLAQRVGQAFGIGCSTITDIKDRPDMVSYASQVMQMEGKW